MFFQSRIALSEQLRKSKELTQKVGPCLNEIEDDDSDEEQTEISDQIIDPSNPWLSERKEFSDFIDGYKNFVQNNCENTADVSETLMEENNESIDNDKSKIEVLKIDKEIKPVDNKINKIKNKQNFTDKVKNITIDELATLSDEESDVEVLKIISPSSKKVKFSNDTIESKEINKSINIEPTALNSKINTNTKRIHTVAGTWLVSTDDNNLKKKKSTHKDVESTFKTVEAELKKKIDVKLENLNNVKVKKSSTKNSIKHKIREVPNNYLKMNKKCIKAEFNESLYEDNKTLDKINSNSFENNQGLSIEIEKKSSKQVENIDPSEFLKVTSIKLETEEMATVEDHLDDKEDNEQEKLIAEAFADDDIINEFK